MYAFLQKKMMRRSINIACREGYIQKLMKFISEEVVAGANTQKELN
jgi:hypothetical protein